MGQFYQYYATLFGNLLVLGTGIGAGWSSPVLPILLSENTSLPSGKITKNEATIIASLPLIGGIFGTILFGINADQFGRKSALYFTTIPYSIGWMLTLAAQNLYYLYAARFLIGFSGGGTLLVIPMYVTEVTEINVRGKLGSFLQLIYNFGILLVYIMGSYFNYYVICSIPLLFSIAFIIGFAFVPETPAYLVLQNRFDDAEKSLKFYRGCSTTDSNISVSVKDELDRMKMTLNEKQFKYSDLTSSDFTNRSAWIGILLSFVCAITITCSGPFMTISYASHLFEKTGSTFSPNMSSIIVGLMSLAGSLITPFLVEHTGRRPLLLLSSSLTGICFAITGLYGYLRNNEYDVDNYYSWISIVGLSGAVFNSSWGIISLAYPIVTELLTIKIRGIIAMISRILQCIFGFILLKVLFDMIDWIGIEGCMWFFAVYNFVYFIIIAMWLPETKGRSIDDIVKSLGKNI